MILAALLWLLESFDNLLVSTEVNQTLQTKLTQHFLSWIDWSIDHFSAHLPLEILCANYPNYLCVM